MHHPPFTTGVLYMHHYNLDNVAALAAVMAVILRSNASCAATFIARLIDALPAPVAGTAPGTARQIHINLEFPGARVSFQF